MIINENGLLTVKCIQKSIKFKIYVWQSFRRESQVRLLKASQKFALSLLVNCFWLLVFNSEKYTKLKICHYSKSENLKWVFIIFVTLFSTICLLYSYFRVGLNIAFSFVLYGNKIFNWSDTPFTSFKKRSVLYQVRRI